jgi:hypothetical protein
VFRTLCLAAPAVGWMTSCAESEKMPHAQPVIHSRMAQKFAGAGLKIATDTAGMPGPSVLIGERGDWQRSA